MLKDDFIEGKAAIKLYTENEKELLKLRIARRSTRVLSRAVAVCISFMFALITVLILLIAAGFAFGAYFENLAIGFLCAGGVGIILTLGSIALTKRLLEKPIIQQVLKDLSDVKL